MFDAILDSVAARFGISLDKAKALLAALTGLIFDNNTGGPQGFVDRLRNAGLGSLVESWIGGGPSQSVAPHQLESALGSNTIASIASRVGLDTGTTGSALSAMLPGVFDALTENGHLPTSIPASLSGLLGGLGGTLGGIGSAAAAAVTPAPPRDTYLPPSAATRTSSRWPLWLLLIAALVVAWLLLRSCNHREAVPPPPPAASTAPVTPAPVAPAPSIVEDAAAALDRLTSGGNAFTAADLVTALNLMVVHFDTDSARISADSLDILQRAAAAIKKAPAGTRIEVGGHTDNTGDAAANLKLSQARADAVVQQLASDGVDKSILRSKGYGQTMPVADNGTDAGRAKNRRIEFTVVN